MWDMIGRISHINYVKRVPDKVKCEPLFLPIESRFSRGTPDCSDLDKTIPYMRYAGMADVICPVCRTNFSFNYKTPYKTMKCIECSMEVNVEAAIEEHVKDLTAFEKAKKEKEQSKPNPCSEIEMNQVVAGVKINTAPIDPLQYDVVNGGFIQKFEPGKKYLCLKTFKTTNNNIAFKESKIYECINGRCMHSELGKHEFPHSDIADYKWNDSRFGNLFIEVTNVKSR